MENNEEERIANILFNMSLEMENRLVNADGSIN